MSNAFLPFIVSRRFSKFTSVASTDHTYIKFAILVLKKEFVGRILQFVDIGGVEPLLSSHSI